MLFAREFEQPVVSIEAYDATMRRGRVRDTGGDRAGAAADIKDGKSRTEQGRQVAMVSLQGAAAKDSGGGAM
jgi:hypothetical protein